MALTRPFIRPLPFGFQRPLNVRNTSDSHALNVERSAIEAAGGTSNRILNGPDGHTGGFIRRPMEVKYVGKDFRFRVGKRDHLRMMAEGGIYIFVDEYGHQVKMSAAQANSLLRYGWLSDKRENNQNYEHSFIFKSDVFR
jgi:hypothetical protein